jgi:hypothetical protein
LNPTNIPGFTEELKRTLKAQDIETQANEQEEMEELTKQYNELNSKFMQDMDAFSSTLLS